MVPVHCQVLSLDGFSAHAGRRELLAFAGALPEPPKQAWLVHGELEAASALCGDLRKQGWTAEVPLQGREAAL